MNLLTDNIKQHIVRHSEKEYPNECCGIIVVNDQEYAAIECENIAKNKREDFRIDGREYVQALSKGDIVAYYHSHPEDDQAAFSQADEVTSKAHGLTSVLYSMKNKQFNIFN